MWAWPQRKKEQSMYFNILSTNMYQIHWFILKSKWFLTSNVEHLHFCVWYKKCAFVPLTPSDECEAPKVFGVWSEGHEDETVKVQAFYQDPVVVGGQKVDEEQHCHFAANLIRKHEQVFHLLFIAAFSRACVLTHYVIIVGYFTQTILFLSRESIWWTYIKWMDKLI